MRFNVKEIYQDRIIIIDEQMKKARLKKDWTSYKRLKWEKERLQQTIKNLPTSEEGRA